MSCYLKKALGLVTLSGELPEKTRERLNNWLVDSIINKTCPDDWGLAPACDELHDCLDDTAAEYNCFKCWTTKRGM